MADCQVEAKYSCYTHYTYLQQKHNMAKSKIQNNEKKATAATPDANPIKTSKPSTLSELRDDRDLWYKIRVLIYDLYKIKDKPCENRIHQTTDVLYISAPYFSPDEAAAVKGALIDSSDGDSTTLEQAIQNSLENFFEKRWASGDYRPCGPHTIVPVYLACFGMDKADIEDEKFVSRIRRSGLGTT
jgi:hypothetical protein